jgi:Cu/Ag efflux pump CusA
MLRFERRLMAKFPEVTTVVTRVGRGEVGAHADPVNSAEASAWCAACVCSRRRRDTPC